MSGAPKVDRRGFLGRGLAVASASLLAGCDSELSDQPWVKRILDKAEALTYASQRALVSPKALAREYSEAEISQGLQGERIDRASTTTHTGHLPRTDLPTGSSRSAVSWDSRSSSSLAELRAMPSRTQITRHDCVEGWSCIGKWTGVPLKALLDKAELKPSARYIVFYCADDLGETGDDEGKYYEIRRSRGRLPSANHPRLRHERRAAARFRMARRSGSASSASSATRWRNM